MAEFAKESLQAVPFADTLRLLDLETWRREWSPEEWSRWLREGAEEAPAIREATRTGRLRRGAGTEIGAAVDAWQAGPAEKGTGACGSGVSRGNRGKFRPSRFSAKVAAMMLIRCLILLVVGCAIFGSDAAPVNQRDLIAHYGQYSGKQLVVSGAVASGPEMSVMYLPSVSEDSATREGMLVTLSEAVSKKPGVLERRFIKALKKAGRVDAVMEGRFEGAPDRRWGHESCCRFRFQVDRVISLK